MVIPLASSEAANGCDKVRAVHDYVAWIVSDSAAAEAAQGMSWAVIPDIISTQALATINNMTCTGRSGLRLCLYTGLRSAADHFMFAELSSPYHINRSAGQARIADSNPEPSALAEMASRASWRTCNGPAPDCPPSVGAAQPCRLPPSPLHTFVSPSSSSRVTSHFNISSPNTQIE